MPAFGCMPPKRITPHFPYPHFFPQNSGSHDITIQFGFGMQVAKTLTYPVMCQFPLFVAPTLLRNGRHYHNISATCNIARCIKNERKSELTNGLSFTHESVGVVVVALHPDVEAERGEVTQRRSHSAIVLAHHAHVWHIVARLNTPMHRYTQQT